MNQLQIARFWAKVDRGPGNACWLWTASLSVRGGYGQFKCGQSVRRAHVVAYELLVERVPAGLVLDHLCRTRRCVNPAHLEPVTPAENTRRGQAPSAVAARTGRCAQGHRFTTENTITRPTGKHECRSCENAAQRRRRHSKKDVA